MDISYFQKINNTYNAKSKQEVDLYLLNQHVDNHFSDSIDYHVVKRNGEPFELLIIKDTDGNTFKKKIKSKHSNPISKSGVNHRMKKIQNLANRIREKESN